MSSGTKSAADAIGCGRARSAAAVIALFARPRGQHVQLLVAVHAAGTAEAVRGGRRPGDVAESAVRALDQRGGAFRAVEARWAGIPDASVGDVVRLGHVHAVQAEPAGRAARNERRASGGVRRVKASGAFPETVEAGEAVLAGGDVLGTDDLVEGARRTTRGVASRGFRAVAALGTAQWNFNAGGIRLASFTGRARLANRKPSRRGISTIVTAQPSGCKEIEKVMGENCDQMIMI